MNGIIIINKPKGCTSHDIVYKIKRMFNQKVGHTGTLDPMAIGVLPILVGKGTLCSKYLINHDKIYEVELQLGKKTDTADIEGNVIEEKEVLDNILDINNVESVLKTFLGKQKQTPPMYSARKVKGKKLYEYARKGQNIEVEPRNIEIYNIQLININKEEKIVKFKVHCSKGTYIRSLCEDIATRLETIGFMKNLNRIQVGDFNIKNAIEIEELEQKINNTEFIDKHFITLEDLFYNSEKIILEDRKLELFLNGVKLTNKKRDGIYKIYNNNKFIGIGVVKDELLKRDIIII